MLDGLAALGRHGASSALLTREGEIVAKADRILLLFRPAWTGHKLLNNPHIKIYDLAELWAFVRPGRAVPPTLSGMTGTTVQNAEDSAHALFGILDDLLLEAENRPNELAPFVNWLNRPGQAYRWPWLDVLESVQNGAPTVDLKDLTKAVPRWTNASSSPQRGAQRTVHEMALRPLQDAYLQGIQEFLEDSLGPDVMLAVGGTGVGKTRAYLAAAAGKDRQIWVSTFTKALQQQVQKEASAELTLPTHIRKGRDNYLCLRLLNEAWGRADTLADGRQRVALICMMRWLQQTQDGDLTGASFPGWMTGLFGPMMTRNLGDVHRECIYAACPFYAQCYAEAARAGSEEAPLVVANHAVMAALAPRFVPEILIMDEAQHVENVMDEALSSGFSLQSASEMHRFLLGISGTLTAGRRGFLDTLAEALPPEDGAFLNQIRIRASSLPGPHAVDRFGSGQPQGVIEQYLYQMGQAIKADLSQDDLSSQFDWDLHRSFVPKAPKELTDTLTVLLDSLAALLTRLEIPPDETGQAPIDPKALVLQNLGVFPVRSWLTQLSQLGQNAPDDFIEWASIKREDGKIRDVGLFRAWRNPLRAWNTMAAAGGSRIVYTTATASPALKAMESALKMEVASPFDYSVQSRILVLTNVAQTAIAQSEAIASLTALSAGSALAVFTAINRLKAAHGKLQHLCAQENLRLFSQHVEGLDVATLIDMFRTEPRALLLGTDAVRDGIDIPGEALKLLMFDRVPWPRPTLLHKERRKDFGGRAYDEDLVRLKLRQAFGRLIRTSMDRGVFVMLDSKLPTRLYDAFPEGAPIERVTLEEAKERLRDFYAASDTPSAKMVQ